MQLDDLGHHADTNGLLVRRALVPTALTRSAWRHAHAMGYLVSMQPGVSRPTGSAPHPAMEIAAAVEAARPLVGDDRIFAGGRTAAYLAGVDVPWGDPIHVVTKGRPQWSSFSGVTVHRPTHKLELVAADAASAIPWTRPTRTLLDVAAWDANLTWTVLEQMIVKRLLAIQDVEAALRRHSKRGRPGISTLRAAVESWGLRQRPPDSVLEARFARLRRAFDLPPFEFQRTVGRYRPDFSRARELLIVECEGFEHHGARLQQVEADKERRAELSADGWLVLGFSWHQINRRDAWVASRIRRTLVRREAQLALPPESR